MHEGHEGMNMGTPEDEPSPEKLAADKRESEFNHHLAGFFVVLAGIFILAQDRLSARWPKVRYAWPVCFSAGRTFCAGLQRHGIMALRPAVVAIRAQPPRRSAPAQILRGDSARDSESLNFFARAER